MYTLLIVISVIGTVAIIYVIRGENLRLTMVEHKKQKKVSFILNPKNKTSKYGYHTNVFMDEEMTDDIAERLKNAYIHP